MSDPFTEESTGEPLASASFTLPPAAPVPVAVKPEAAETVMEPREQTQPLYVSPVLMQLADLDESLLPNPTPACETCPSGMWFTTTEVVKCYCSRMHVMTWISGGDPPPVMRCDGRELALMQMAEDLASRE